MQPKPPIERRVVSCPRGQVMEDVAKSYIRVELLIGESHLTTLPRQKLPIRGQEVYLLLRSYVENFALQAGFWVDHSKYLPPSIGYRALDVVWEILQFVNRAISIRAVFLSAFRDPCFLNRRKEQMNFGARRKSNFISRAQARFNRSLPSRNGMVSLKPQRFKNAFFFAQTKASKIRGLGVFL